ncbi:MAG: bifunctional 4-hydroxy-2-oxoglutarate aldolase/2-dehydro-3-deoxy-phosphogluconate aldolase [Proteobacteria bacterium]|nr:bifunctional 4-hydroxy-2-oxoglutarate aldolase/2-dehydro-3-deoxy-phosphogluconate aldolase [Pseudomonadota bacterium]MBU1737119.1 bifunctional 4-hydroxy-2-oxoglutarate aldolase/2-dehydro-3-deoxy-phosphogluconate aldolase [Pseudomonadota bacterium]
MQLDVPVIGILRGVEGSFFRELMAVAFGAGLQAMEITMNTPGAVDIVAGCRGDVPADRYLGMGTVRCLEEARAAIDCGAMFLVTPNTSVRVIEFAGKKGVPVIAGAFTPTEVYTAWSAGAEMVKVFPCGVVGPEYIRELRGPFDQIPMIAVGGVNIHNIGDYFACGAAGVGIGNSLFGRAAMAEKDLESVAKNVGEYLNAIRKATADSIAKY